MRFHMDPVGDRPVLDLSPHHARMATCYRDRTGTYRLFTDFVDASLRTVHSWQARIEHYESPDLVRWRRVGTAVSPGRWSGKEGGREADCYGAGSPHVLPSGGAVRLFYSGRGNLHPQDPFDGSAAPGEPGYVSADIMAAVAEADPSGAPAGPFRKRGALVRREGGCVRLDDPCAVAHDGRIRLYYKKVEGSGGSRKTTVHAATAAPGSLSFSGAVPIQGVGDGVEMPRVFRHACRWHLFLRHFAAADGTPWRHYVSEDGIRWDLLDPRLFRCAGPEPGRGATDIMLVYGPDGEAEGHVLACGMEDGVLKLWLYRMTAADSVPLPESSAAILSK